MRQFILILLRLSIASYAPPRNLMSLTCVHPASMTRLASDSRWTPSWHLIRFGTPPSEKIKAKGYEPQRWHAETPLAHIQCLFERESSSDGSGAAIVAHTADIATAARTLLD
jgi:hypothetical protein